MSFLYRLGYFLGGFSAGLVVLFFLFNGKRTQCNYGPEARVINNLSEKNWETKTALLSGMSLDSTSVQLLLKHASVNFSESDTKRDSCKRYSLAGYYREKEISWEVENCKKTVYIIDIVLKP